jgi:hypothetical protein
MVRITVCITALIALVAQSGRDLDWSRRCSSEDHARPSRSLSVVCLCRFGWAALDEDGASRRDG